MQSKISKRNTANAVISSIAPINPLIHNWLSWQEEGAEIIPIDPKSDTVPDMTMSLQELLLRHTNGREVPEHHGYFDDEELDEFFPDLRRLDMVEVQELIEQTNDHVGQIQGKLQKLQSDAFKAQMDEYHAEREKEGAERTSDPKQRQPQGGSKSGEADKPQASGGQSH